MDNHRPELDYGLSDFDVKSHFVSNFVYELPVGRGKGYLSNANRAVDAVIGGWQVGGIVTLQKGFPFSIGANDFNCLLDMPFCVGLIVPTSFPGRIQTADSLGAPQSGLTPRLLSNLVRESMARRLGTISGGQASTTGICPCQKRGTHGADALPVAFGRIQYVQSPRFQCSE